MTEHCEMHERNMDVIRNHGEQITDLYEKYGEIFRLLSEIKVCTASNAVEMRAGFTASSKAISELTVSVDNIRIERITTLQKYDTIVEDFKSRIVDLEKFDWFRKTMNKWKDNLPWMALKAILFVILLLSVLHFSGMMGLIKEYLKR